MENVIGKRSKPAIILKALVISYILTAILLLLLAFLLFKFELDEGKVSIGIIIIYLLAGAVGGFFVGKKTGSQKFLWGMVLGAVYFILLLVISLIAGHGIQTQPMQLVTTGCLCIGGGMLGGMLS